MFTVFVTGSLASGKRAACLHLVERGFLHIDLDEMAKGFLDEEDVRQQIVAAYGSGILNDQEGIDRRALAREAFRSSESSEALNGIIWPLVHRRLSDLIFNLNCQQHSQHTGVVVEIPMLAEAPDLRNLADTVLCISTDDDIRVKRALARGMERDDFNKRKALQASDEERVHICDAVIENNGTLEELHDKLDDWLSLLQQEHMF